jgi:hypothetical protein
MILTPKNIMCILIWLLLLKNGAAQRIDLSIKAGAAKLFAAPISVREGYAYVTAPPPWPYPVLYFEANKRNVLKKINVLAGIGLLPTFSHISINPKNIKDANSIEAATTIYGLQMHLGVEREMGHENSKINKNHFSIWGAIGFNLTGKIIDSMDLGDGGYTQNNEVFQGTKVTFQHSAFFGPTLVAAGRYHIRNRKGAEILAMDLLLNYNLSHYFQYTFQYSIDNVPTTESIPEKGISMQILFVKRLFWIKR